MGEYEITENIPESPEDDRRREADRCRSGGATMQSITGKEVGPGVQDGPTADQKLTQKEKKVSGTFRHRETRGQPCLSILSSIITLVPGSKEPTAQQDKTYIRDLMHVSGYPPTDIRLEASNLLTAISEHDPYINHIERAIIDNAIDVLDNSRTREDAILEDAAIRRNQDKARAKAIGADPDNVPELEDYICLRGMA